MPKQSPNTHRLAPIPGTCTLIFSSYVLFYSLPQPHNATASHPSPRDNLSERWRAIRKTQGQTKMAVLNSITYICTRAGHSFPSFAHCRAASTVIPLLPKATSTPSIQPNLGLPVPTLSTYICLYDTVLAIR